jgi:hypothetical protein
MKKAMSEELKERVNVKVLGKLMYIQGTDVKECSKGTAIHQG